MKRLDTRKPNFAREFSAILKKRASFRAEVEEKIPSLFAAVEKKEVAALLKFARKFDGFKGRAEDLKVSAQEINSSLKALSPAQAEAIALAAKRIWKFHRRQLPKNYRLAEKGAVLEERWVPLRRVGLYIPAGKAPLASTVLMTAIPARLAGVKEIALATPSSAAGQIHPAILFAARLAGISEIYRVGGAHAIAALALGAGPIHKVDKIFGPGGVWVSAAKVYAQSRGLCGIDTLAGPSEIMVLADGSAPPQFAAADLAAQLEHGPDSWAFLLCSSQKYLDQVLSRQKIDGKNLVLVLVRGRKEMIELANRVAPEHLELHLEKPEAALGQLTAAPAIFLGPYSPVAAGDYVAGPNHSLPTAGRAAFDSPLGVWDFMKRQSIVSLSAEKLKELAKTGEVLAELEGLHEHARSLWIRSGKNRKR
jgi:histidinol dehydrogenase